jgi:hypothetical protein
LETCPLCGGEPRHDREPEIPEYAPASEPIPARVARRLIARSILLVGTAAVAILIIVDVGIDGRVDWSPLTATATAGGTFLLRYPFVFRRWVRAAAASLITTLLMLVLIDLLADGTVDWFFAVAVPITAAAGVLTVPSVLLFRRTRGVAKAAVPVLAAGLLTVAVDAAVTFSVGGTIGVGWSLIVLIATAPVAALLVLLQRTVIRHIDLRRRFHLSA